VYIIVIFGSLTYCVVLMCDRHYYLITIVIDVSRLPDRV